MKILLFMKHKLRPRQTGCLSALGNTTSLNRFDKACMDFARGSWAVPAGSGFFRTRTEIGHKSRPGTRMAQASFCRIANTVLCALREGSAVIVVDCASPSGRHLALWHAMKWPAHKLAQLTGWRPLVNYLSSFRPLHKPHCIVDVLFMPFIYMHDFSSFLISATMK